MGILDLNGAGAQETADRICESGGQAKALTCDISDYDEVKTAVAEIENANGPSDILVNNAGWDQAARFLDTNPEFWGNPNNPPPPQSALRSAADRPGFC